MHHGAQITFIALNECHNIVSVVFSLVINVELNKHYQGLKERQQIGGNEQNRSSVKGCQRIINNFFLLNRRILSCNLRLCTCTKELCLNLITDEIVPVKVK